MYFETFPEMYYDFVKLDGSVDYVRLKDITQNIRFKKEVLESITLYEYYDMNETDTPEIVSEKFYGSPLYHWVIMIANQKYDYIEDFPLAIPELEARITDKYGAGHEYDTHHYEEGGWVVDPVSYPNATSVSNYEYEVRENEKKRRVKIISPTMLQVILKQFREVM